MEEKTGLEERIEEDPDLPNWIDPPWSRESQKPSG
jgi:hypothetical protein